jgi:hypothetical protein
MTWEEMGKKYEQDTREKKPARKTLKLDKNWDNLVKSTDKLIWLFSLSGGTGQQKSG